jgi:mono/diheme cytochrome c family protein
MNKQFRTLSGACLAAILAGGLAGCAAPPAPPPAAVDCPQPKFTGKAPPDFYNRTNPLAAAAIDLKLGEKLYFDEVPGRYSCATCHGRSGNGRGPMSSQFVPPPRNLACIKVANIPDGQVFWTIRNGSPGTDMPAHTRFNDEQTWQLVAYLKNF